MSQTNRSDAPLFQVRNHHSAACGAPPHIDDLRPNQYLGYFENQYGEQAVFVYDRDSSQAVLYLGDAGWQPPHVVIDGMVPDLVLAETERHWVPCLLASRHSEPKGGLNMIDNPATVAGLIEQLHGHLPLPAFPTKEIVRTLRRGGVQASIERSHVFYAGDEAGIVCDVTPTRNAKRVVLVSLTHLRVVADHPLAAAILGYQLERVRRLAAADQAP